MRIVGQEAALAVLDAALARTGGEGSTLIHGPEGVGRFLLALHAAVRILGDEARVVAGTHPDLLVVLPDVGIKVLRERFLTALARRPADGPRQVLIVRDADRMHPDVHHTLLKTLEEPPAGAAILLVAQGPEFLPETVVSRCRLVRARPLREEQTAQVLEALGLPPERAADAEGSPGRGVYQHEHGIAAAAERLLELLAEPHPDALGAAEKLCRKKPGEERREHRRRMEEVLRVAARRLRDRLPESENALRSLVEGLRSLEANANPAILFADLVLVPWRNP